LAFRLHVPGNEAVQPVDLSSSASASAPVVVLYKVIADAGELRFAAVADLGELSVGAAEAGDILRSGHCMIGPGGAAHCHKLRRNVTSPSLGRTSLGQIATEGKQLQVTYCIHVCRYRRFCRYSNLGGEKFQNAHFKFSGTAVRTPPTVQP
jgi:hypothetical protein